MYIFFSVDHWNFSVTNDETWVIPDGINKSDVSTVTISVSLCKPLPEGNCKANVNSTICEHITLKNGTEIDIDMSSFNKDEKFVQLEDNGKVFFLLFNLLLLNYRFELCMPPFICSMPL